MDDVRQAISIGIEIARDHAQPMLLVDRALARIDDPTIDQIWLLIDVEAPAEMEHPHLLDVAASARMHDKLHVAASNPCFELWLILHDQDVGGYLTTKEAVKRAQDLEEVSGKVLRDAESLIRRRHDAVRRAELLRRRHERNNKAFPANNPGTEVDRFVLAVEAAAKDQA